MQKEQTRKRATYYTADHPALTTVIYLTLAGITYHALEALEDETTVPWINEMICAMFLLFAVSCALRWMYFICFTSEGLTVNFLFWECRRISWNEIIQVGIVMRYKNPRLTIAFTPAGCPQFDGSNTTTYVERYCLRLILIDATKENIATVRTLYGKFDYQCPSWEDYNE